MKTSSAVFTSHYLGGVEIEVSGNIYFEEDGDHWDDLEMFYVDTGTPLSEDMMYIVENDAIEALNESYHGY